jgi:hypothetical protein
MQLFSYSRCYNSDDLAYLLQLISRNMMDKERIEEEIVRCYHDLLNYECESANYLRSKRVSEALIAEAKKSREGGKIYAYFTVLGDTETVLYDDLTKTAWERLTPEVRYQLKQISLENPGVWFLDLTKG